MKYFKKDNIEAEHKIEDLINQVRKELICCLDKKVVSILLRGSLARGEGAWKNIDGNLKIISDLDLFLITKARTVISKRLKDQIIKIGKEARMSVHLHTIDLIRLKFMDKDLWLFDTKNIGIVIYGKDIPKMLMVEQMDINSKDIIALFFHRVFSSIIKCSPDDFSSSSQSALENLSLAASEIMFTCVDIIIIYSGNYYSSLFERVNFLENKFDKVGFDIDKEKLLSDINKALNFKFFQTEKFFLEEAQDFLLIAKDHLINLFFCFMKMEYNTQDILMCLYLENRNIVFKNKARSILTRMIIAYRLLRIKKLPKFPWSAHPRSYCMAASLMPFIALDKTVNEDYVIKGTEYLSKIYFQGQNTQRTWVTLRNELELLYNSGINLFIK